jgi:hypothetical protein
VDKPLRQSRAVVADLDGARMIDLSRREFDAYDGLYGADGDFGSWVATSPDGGGRGQVTGGTDTARRPPGGLK